MGCENKKYTNIKEIIDDLSEQYSNTTIGLMFYGSLIKNKLDMIAFKDIKNPTAYKNLQSNIISKVKSRMTSHIFLPYDSENINLTNIYIVNNDSLTGVINNLFDKKGNSAFEDISQALISGSENYLKKVPLAKIMNAHQFKEYREIKKEIEKFL